MPATKHPHLFIHLFQMSGQALSLLTLLFVALACAVGGRARHHEREKRDVEEKYTDDDPRTCTWEKYHPLDGYCRDLQGDAWTPSTAWPYCRLDLKFSMLKKTVIKAPDFSFRPWNIQGCEFKLVHETQTEVGECWTWLCEKVRAFFNLPTA